MAVEAQKKSFRNIAAGIHAVMERRRKTAHIEVRAFFHDLFHRRLLARDNRGLHAFLHAFVTGDSGPANIHTKSPREAETASHQKSYQRHLRAPAIDDHVMTNEDGKALRLLELYRQRSDLPLGPERLLDVNDLFRIGGFVEFDKLMQVRAECIGTVCRRSREVDHNQYSRNQEYSPQRHRVRRGRNFLNRKLFTPRPPRLRGEFSRCFSSAQSVQPTNGVFPCQAALSLGFTAEAQKFGVLLSKLFYSASGASPEQRR